MATVLQKLRSIGNNLWRGGRAPTPRPRPYREMGVSGTAVYGGYVQIKERSPEWTGRQKWITASELAVNTSIVAAGVHHFLNLVAYPSWSFKPHDEEDEESLALAEFAEHVLSDMDTPWYKVVRRAAMYRFAGFGVQEWTAKHRSDGLIGFKDIEARPQHTIEQWDVDFDGTVLGLWQRSPQTGNMLGIPRDKVLYLVEDTLTDSPEGIGMFRHMADPYRRLKQLQELEMRAYERDLRGTPIARAPLTFINKAVKSNVITQAQATELITTFENLVKLQVKQSDTGVILDSMPYFSDSDAGDQVSGVPQWGFELLTGAGVGHAEIAAAIDRVQREIARIGGWEHIMMGDTGGNRALAEDKSRNIYLIGNSVLKYIAAAVKQDILVPLWKLNGFPMDKMPEPKPEDVTFKNAEAITNALAKMASAGAPLSPTDPVINDVRDLLGVSRQPEDLAAQGQMQDPNALLAALPPELQAAAMGGVGAGPGGPPGAGPGAAGGPKKPNKGGGKPFPGKRFSKEEDDEDEKSRRRAAQDALDDGDGDEPAGDSADDLSDQVETLAAAVTGDTAAGGSGQGQGGEQNKEQLVQLITQLISQIANNNSGDEGSHPALEGGRGGKDGDDETSKIPPGPERLAIEAEAIRAETEGRDKKPKKEQQGAEGDGKDGEEGTPKGEGKAPAAKPAKPSAGDGADAKPTADGGPAKPAKPALGASKPAADPTSGVEDAEVLRGAKPAAGAPGAKPVAPGAAPKPPVSGVGAADKPKPGTPAAGAAGEGKPGEAKPGEPGEPQPGQPGAVDPETGLPAPGAVPEPEPEMTPERASEILQPYATPGVTPEEQEPRTESDLLWERLGQEKDVQAAVSDQDPMDVIDGDADELLLGEGGKPGNGEGDEGAEQPEDGDVTDELREPVRRVRLNEVEDDESTQPLPKKKPVKRFR